ncbi:MAG: MarR family transcriptional regulator [Deltaproteobacteria bacterium]|nr:MarR family transcriptional regulator [Deltaproteobacteria bacterium]
MGTVQDDENSDPVERRILQACDAVGEFIAYWGFKNIHGRIWTLLALRREPLTQADISRKLGVSRGLVSMSIDDLRKYGLVRSVGDERGAPCAAVFDVWPTVSDILRSREWMLVETARLAFEGALEELNLAEARGARTAYDPSRVRALLAMTEVAQGFLKILLKLRAPPQLEVFTGWLGRATGVVARVREVLNKD